MEAEPTVALDHTRLLKPLKKLRRLLNTLDSDSAPEHIHDLRTSARRIEAAFNALDLDDAGTPRSVIKELGRPRKRAGKVRDMDVLTEFAATINPKGEAEPAAGASGCAVTKNRPQRSMPGQLRFVDAAKGLGQDVVADHGFAQKRAALRSTPS